MAATIPNCNAYDPAYAGELVVILDAGMREMLVEQHDVFYYITLMNENYAQRDLPEGLLRGAYLLQRFETEGARGITLLGSGAILTEVIEAADVLSAEGFAVAVVSVTSWSELARDGMACEAPAQATPWIAQVLAGTRSPIIATSGYVRAVPESVRAYLPQTRSYRTLGPDGFGRSDTRAALWRFFRVDAASIISMAHTLYQAHESQTQAVP